MKRSAFDLLLSRSDYARTNTGWLNFQKIIHPVFIFNEFATLRLCDFVAIKSSLNLATLNQFEIPRDRHANR